jgi:peptidoglycan/xylan/chitin deacetylase (PgdA/CDA1 family)
MREGRGRASTRWLVVAFLVVLVGGAMSTSAQPARTVAITIDDLPYTGRSLEEAERATEALLESLETHDAPADVFVTGERVEVGDEIEARQDLLRRWLAAGHALQNHSYSHLHYSAEEPARYFADVERGHALVASLLADVEPGERVQFFRAPYNDLGDTADARDALVASLHERGVELAPFTVEHADYAFDALYQDAFTRGDTACAERIGRAYLAQLDTAFAFAEQLSRDTFGREIPQVFLIHANRINADYLDAMLARLRERGYAFVTLSDAVADPAYETENAYGRKWGVSWLHRWRVGLGKSSKLRDEPGLPAWSLEAYQALGQP